MKVLVVGDSRKTCKSESNDSILATIDLNFVFQLGVASFTMKGVNHMRTDQGKSGGTIINISSGAGICKFSIVPIYCGSKAAVLQFGRSLAVSQEINYIR